MEIPFLSSITDFGRNLFTSGVPGSNKKTHSVFSDNTGEIRFKQGRMGDCWFLSTYTSCENNPQLKAIVDKGVTSDGKGGYNITFAGDVNKTKYHITREDLNSTQYSNFSTGDDRVKAIEIAADKYFNANPETKNKIRDGGDPSLAFKLLTNRDTITSANLNTSEVKNKLDGLNINASKKNGDYITKNDQTIALQAGTVDNPTSELGLVGRHGNSVTEVANGNFSVIDPHDPTKVIKMPIDKAAQNFKDFVEVHDLQLKTFKI